MILPTKHIKISNSLLNVGAILLRHLKTDQTVTSLWVATHRLPEITTFYRFTLGLDFLFMISAIDFKEGLLRRAAR